MTIMGDAQGASEDKKTGKEGENASEAVQEHATQPAAGDQGTKSDPFWKEDLPKASEVEVDDGAKITRRTIEISPEDKVRFIESVATNVRFTKDYSMFNGKMSLTLRSLTTDEVNALAAWTAAQGTRDSAGLVTGRYRKYLMAAHCARIDGVDMPPLEEPLFEHLGKDGKTVEPPSWVNRCDYFDGMSYGKFQTIMKCIVDFDERYSILCQKAEDESFWNPDTP